MVARLRDVLLAADELPHPRPHALHLQVEERLRGEDAPAPIAHREVDVGRSPRVGRRLDRAEGEAALPIGKRLAPALEGRVARAPGLADVVVLAELVAVPDLDGPARERSAAAIEQAPEVCWPWIISIALINDSGPAA